MKKKGLPTFFNYKEEGPTDNGYETLQDFFLSWTLRCSSDKYKNQNNILQEYSRQIVHLLIHGYTSEEGIYVLKKEIPDDFIVLDVKTKRQWNYIDLLAEVEVSENSKNKKYIINIENKWYTYTSERQLKKYKLSITNEFGKQDVSIINLVIFCDSEMLKKKPDQLSICLQNGYNVITINEIKELTDIKQGEITTNSIFDEYWFYF